MSMPHHIDRIDVYNKDGSLRVYPDDYEDKELRGKVIATQIIHPELHKWNKGGGATFNGFRNSWRDEIVKLERYPQKNASLTICFNNSASEEFWEELRKKYPVDEDYYSKCEEFFKDCREFLDKLYPYGKTLKWTTHYEEKTPHQHCLKIPILRAPRRLNKKDKEAKKELGEAVIKFSSGEFLGGREGLAKLQDAAFEKLGKKWGLERGERGSDAKHTDQIEWQRELSLKDKELTNGLKMVNEIRDTLKQKEEELNKREIYVKKTENAIEYMKKKLPGEDQIAVTVIAELNSNNVTQEERKKFYNDFPNMIKNLVKDFIERIRGKKKPIKETNIDKMGLVSDKKNEPHY